MKVSSNGFARYIITCMYNTTRRRESMVTLHDLAAYSLSWNVEAAPPWSSTEPLMLNLGVLP